MSPVKQQKIHMTCIDPHGMFFDDSESLCEGRPQYFFIFIDDDDESI